MKCTKIKCNLKKNWNNKRCVLLRKAQHKSKSSLSWKEAKARYPCLKPYGNADKDKHVNIKDCRPFNKRRHVIYTSDKSDFGTHGNIVYTTPKEYLGFTKIHYGRKMGLPPIETHKEMKKDGLTGDEMRTALELYEKNMKGEIEVVKGLPSWYTQRMATTIKTGQDPFLEKFHDYA
jgi:hypothetical protein